MPYTSPGSLGEAWAGPGSLGGSSIQWVCLGVARWQVGGGANQLQQIFRPLTLTVAPILGWDPPQVLMGEGHLSRGQVSHFLRPPPSGTFPF